MIGDWAEHVCDAAGFAKIGDIEGGKGRPLVGTEAARKAKQGDEILEEAHNGFRDGTGDT